MGHCRPEIKREKDWQFVVLGHRLPGNIPGGTPQSSRESADYSLPIEERIITEEKAKVVFGGQNLFK